MPDSKEDNTGVGSAYPDNEFATLSGKTPESPGEWSEVRVEKAQGPCPRLTPMQGLLRPLHQ